MKKKKMAILVAVTSNIAFAAGNIAIALDKYMHDIDYEIIVYYDELPQSDIDAFNKISKCNLKKFRPDEKLVDYLLEKLPSGCPYKGINKLMLLGHYEIFKLLDDYENAIWLDADILVQGDIYHIIQYGPLGITADTPWKVRNQFMDTTIEMDNYNLDLPAVCTAVIMINDSLPYKEIYNWLIEKTYFHAENMKNIDQVTFNLMLQEFNILPSIMPLEEYQCMPWKENAYKAKIVHFGTAEKVWKSRKLSREFSEWYRNHIRWLELGGSDFDRRQFK